MNKKIDEETVKIIQGIITNAVNKRTKEVFNDIEKAMLNYDFYPEFYIYNMKWKELKKKYGIDGK